MIQNAVNMPKTKVVLEAGCGVGNTMFPLIKLNPDKYFYAFDFSPFAIDIMKKNPEYNEEKITAFVCDPTREEVPPNIVADNSVDIAIMVFFMSAVDPAKMDNVLRHIYKTLKPGGVVILRDYGLYDMTQMRFINKKGRKLGENFYMRADGTRTYFFSKENLESMFNAAGFTTSVVKYNTRELRNRKRRLSMYRYGGWLYLVVFSCILLYFVVFCCSLLFFVVLCCILLYFVVLLCRVAKFVVCRVCWLFFVAQFLITHLFRKTGFGFLEDL